MPEHSNLLGNRTVKLRAIQNLIVCCFHSLMTLVYVGLFSKRSEVKQVLSENFKWERERKWERETVDVQGLWNPVFFSASESLHLLATGHWSYDCLHQFFTVIILEFSWWAVMDISDHQTEKKKKNRGKQWRLISSCTITLKSETLRISGNKASLHNCHLLYTYTIASFVPVQSPSKSNLV